MGKLPLPYKNITSLDSSTNYSSLDPSKSFLKKVESDGLKISLIEDIAEFSALKDSWNALLNETVEPFPFLSWEWQYTWWETFAKKDNQLFIICIHEHDQLIGIAPFYIKNNTLGKVLKLIGEGEAIHEAVITHYQDIICAKEKSDRVTSAVFEYIDAHTSWDFVEFSFVLNDSNLHTLMEKVTPFLKFNTSLGHRYVLDLKRSFEDLYSSLGKSSKKSFRSKKNRLSKEGELSLSSLDVTNDIDKSLDTHSFFHTHRQQALGRKGNFLEPNFRKFHRSLIERLKGTGRVDIRVLNLDDKPIACTLNYLSNNTENPMVYSYSSGYKSENDARLSPMFIFDMLEFENLIDKKVASYDFLSSTDAVSYKDTYRCDMQAVTRLRWFEMTLFGMGAYAILRARKMLSPIKANTKILIKRIGMVKLNILATLKTYLLISTEKLSSIYECYLMTVCSIT